MPYFVEVAPLKSYCKVGKREGKISELSIAGTDPEPPGRPARSAKRARSACAGSEAAHFLSVLLPSNSQACRMAGVRLHDTGALLARDLAQRGRYATARRALIDAWSHCHLTTIRALARQPWNGPLKFRHLTLRSNFSGDSGSSIRASRTCPRRCRYGVANRGAGMSWMFDRRRDRPRRRYEAVQRLPSAGVPIEVGVRVSAPFPAGTK